MNPRHNHTANENNSKIRIAKAETTNDLLPRVVISEAMSSLSFEKAILMPSFKSCAKNIQNLRNKHELGSDVTEVEIPNVFKFTVRSRSFLFFDSGQFNENRILFFSTDENLSYLENCETWVCDGTFRMVPAEFLRLYVIYGKICRNSVPLAFSLLRNKTKESYKQLFKMLKEKISFIKLKLLILDFEEAVILAAKESFPILNIRFCMFHFGQVFYRNIQKYVFSSRYNADLHFRIDLKNLLSLAFVGVVDVFRVFGVVKCALEEKY